FPDAVQTWEKVEEELAEVREVSDAKADARDLEAEFGDLLFAIVNFARFQQIDPESALQRANAKFTRRFAHIEERLRAEGRTAADADLAEMDRLWEESKGLEDGGLTMEDRGV